jgi:N utilization substance protein B
MGKRSTSRRLAMQALYQAELSRSSIEEALTRVLESEKFIPETVEFAKKLARASWEKREEIDKIIASLTIDWPLDRLSKVDHSILRLALSEIKLGEVPPSVVIDEAVELAKKYSTDEAAKFINGILGAYLRKKE